MCACVYIHTCTRKTKIPDVHINMDKMCKQRTESEVFQYPKSTGINCHVPTTQPLQRKEKKSNVLSPESCMGVCLLACPAIVAKTLALATLKLAFDYFY